MPIEQEQRHVYYDRDLQIEAYNLSGIVQKFPNHFHEYYVIGFVEGGKRHLWCKGREYDLSAGDLILFNPRDNHFCAPVNEEILDYRAVNINQSVMLAAVQKFTEKNDIPYFSQNVVYQSQIVHAVGDLYDAILNRESKAKKEEIFFALLKQVLQNDANSLSETGIPEVSNQIQKLCAYMEEHFAENIKLDELLTMVNFGKSYLLRSFAKQVGVSPYRYLQTIRLDRAKNFLEQGIAPIDVASMAGFSDQSHFTNFFKEYIGLTPRQYQKIFNEPPELVDAAKE